MNIKRIFNDILKVQLFIQMIELGINDDLVT